MMPSKIGTTERALLDRATELEHQAAHLRSIVEYKCTCGRPGYEGRNYINHNPTCGICNERPDDMEEKERMVLRGLLS